LEQKYAQLENKLSNNRSEHS